MSLSGALISKYRLFLDINEKLRNPFDIFTNLFSMKDSNILSAGTTMRLSRIILIYYCKVYTVRERDNWVDPGVDGSIILRRIFRKWDVGLRTGLSWLRIEAGGGHL
jgi:hypothetical protein